MKGIFLSNLIAFVLVSTFARPESKDSIDLSQLGQDLYGSPVENNGTITIDPKKNPEEFGPYLEGDLLVPIKARNGMKSESLRWKNGEVPYIIRGRYSKLKVNYEQSSSQFNKSLQQVQAKPPSFRMPSISFIEGNIE